MGKKELFQIGDVARLFHISVGSLRHYEKIGLIKPEYIDESTGYRYYSTRQFECLNTIRYLRVLDMPLPQIADFLKNRKIEKIQEMLCQQKETVIRKQKELKSIERKIQNRLKRRSSGSSRFPPAGSHGCGMIFPWILMKIRILKPLSFSWHRDRKILSCFSEKSAPAFPGNSFLQASMTSIIWYS